MKLENSCQFTIFKTSLNGSTEGLVNTMWTFEIPKRHLYV